MSANGRQVQSLLLLFLTGWVLTMNSGNRDDWIAVLLACVAGTILFALFCLPSERIEGNYFLILQSCYGTIFGSVLTVLLCLYAFWSLCMTVISSAVFLRTVSENEWQIWLIALVIVLTAGYAAEGGAARLALWCEPIMWVVLAALVLSLILTLPKADFANLTPILADGVRGIRGYAAEILAVPFAECWFAAALLSGRSTGLRQSGLMAVIAAGVLLSLTALRNTAVLGAGAESVWYPTFTAAGLIELGESFQRGEVLVSGSLMLCTMLRTAVFLCFITDGIQNVVPNSTRKACIITVGVVVIILCTLLAGSTQDFRRAELFYRIISLPALTLFASVTAIVAVIKAKNNRSA